MRQAVSEAVLNIVDNFGSDDGQDEDGEDECIDCMLAENMLEDSARRRNRKERHFVSTHE